MFRIKLDRSHWSRKSSVKGLVMLLSSSINKILNGLKTESCSDSANDAIFIVVVIERICDVDNSGCNHNIIRQSILIESFHQESSIFYWKQIS